MGLCGQLIYGWFIVGNREEVGLRADDEEEGERRNLEVVGFGEGGQGDLLRYDRSPGAGAVLGGGGGEERRAGFGTSGEEV